MSIVRVSLLHKIFVSCVFAIVFAIYYILSNSTPVKTILHFKGSTKYVLYWNTLSKVKDYMGKGYRPFESCEVNDCYLTSEKNLLPMELFDAILFHGAQYTFSKHGKPPVRHPRQVYIFLDMEAPAPYLRLRLFDSFFNWTMTYRRDSDIVLQYGYFEKKATNYIPPTAEELQARFRFAAWFVSNCNSANNREQLVSTLQKHFPVDIYGKCGTFHCERRDNEFCLEMLESTYKFYLAFENSFCEDYVTEKLFTTIQKNIIPIVFGGANYSLFAPPNSVIDIKDFKNLDELVYHVLYLDQNPEEYLKYFEWKKDYVVRQDVPSDTLCTLCEKLHNKEEPIKVYDDLEKWWFRKDDVPKCKSFTIH